jgi:hypothetical protein
MSTQGIHIAFLLVACALRLVQSQTEPNLLVVMTDEQNLRTIGAYRKLMNDEQAFPWGGKVFVDTPNIDRLAAEGMFYPKRKYSLYAVSDILDALTNSTL